MGKLVRLAEEPFYGFQGEGSTQGKLSLFIRFSGCNLSCTLCDSTFASRQHEEHIFELGYLKRVVEERNSNIVFTGGEPFLYIDKLYDFICSIENTVEIETNGTIVPDELYGFMHGGVQFNISPKENIKQDSIIDTKPHLLRELKRYDRYCVKFLLQDDSDIDYVKDVQSRYNIPDEKVYIQPVGTHREALYKIVEKYYNTIIGNKWNLSARLHVLFFNDKRGV
jgi:organic radical activating enzyme